MGRNALKPLLAGGLLALGLIAALATGEPPEGRDPQSSLLLRVVDEGSSLLSRGTPAPDFDLPDAAGENTVSLGDLKGESAAAVFVSFSCPYSRQLMRTVLDEGLPDLGQTPAVHSARGRHRPGAGAGGGRPAGGACRTVSAVAGCRRQHL